MARILGYVNGNPIYEGENVAQKYAQYSSQSSAPTVNENLPAARGNEFADSYEAEGLNNAPMIQSPSYQGMTSAQASSQPFLYQDQQSATGYRVAPVPTLSVQEASNLASPYGFKAGEFTGLTMAQANSKIDQKKQAIGAQVSQNTSFTFNPEAISGANKKFGDMKLQLDGINNDAWKSQEQKKLESKALINSFNTSFASLFQTPEEFQQAVQSSPDLQKTMMDYQRAGGSMPDISSQIGKNNTTSVIGYRDNADGTTTNFLSDGTKSTGKLSLNPDGSYSFSETEGNIQSTADYLGNLSTPEDKRAFEALIPESKIYQEQISFEQSIPDKYKDYYFGTPEQQGFIQQQKSQAEERIKLIDEKARLEKDNQKLQAQYLISKAQAELDYEQSTVEENRMAAKNYMTGMLAKLGALNTTGKAGEALVTLEQKYQRQSQQLRTQFNNGVRQVEMKLNENVNSIDMDKIDNILKVKENLSKTEEEVNTEVLKLQTAADRKTFDILDKYASEFRTVKEKYVNEAKKKAEDDLKERKRIMEKYDPNQFLREFGGGIKNVKGVGVKKSSGTGSGSSNGSFSPTQIRELANARISNVDLASKRYFLNTEPAFRQWFSREVAEGRTPPNISGAYEQWKENTKKKTTDSSVSSMSEEEKAKFIESLNTPKQ